MSTATDRPYRHEDLDKLKAVLSDARIGEPAKARVREELAIRAREIGQTPAAQRQESPARSMRFCLPMPTNRANRSSQTRHWSAIWKDDQKFRAVCDALLEYGALPKPPAHPFRRVRLEATLYVGNLMDDDNALARLKPAVDWLVKKGYIVDDTREHIEREMPEQEVDRICPRVVLRLRPPKKS